MPGLVAMAKVVHLPSISDQLCRVETLAGVRRFAAPRSSSGPHSEGHHLAPIGVSCPSAWLAPTRTAIITPKTMT